MLELRNIVKTYKTGDSVVSALSGVSLCFRENEFVSILGASGCGKTTLLNIVGGLDRYTDGDLIINGKSTKFFRDRDWDTYRNHSVGFVFQSYNLIPHQTVLANVELALTLSGVSKSVRRAKAIKALQNVGLGDQLHKKPNQMSGGQMQRVAIARALVNDPDILLADEPTGALDTHTSVQIMELLKEVAKDRLVIMVTHNPELAEEYSTRIVRLSDGQVVGDTNPISEDEYNQLVEKDRQAIIDAKKNKKERKAKEKKSSMSFATAVSLSFKNLLTKKGRTVMTSFAGSIGIIGIALILALSTGINLFINDVQEDTLSSFPITIYEKETNLSAMIEKLAETTNSEDKKHENDAVYSNPMLYDLIHSMSSATEKTNNLKAFKKYIDNRDNSDIGKYISAVQYTYDVDINMYTKDSNGKYNKADISSLFTSMMSGAAAGTSSSDMASSFMSFDTWCEILPGKKDSNGSYDSLVSDAVKNQYELVYGEWPDAKDEVILILDKNNEINDMTLYALGLISKEEITNTIIAATKADGEYKSEMKKFSYKDICNVKYKMILNSDYYEKDSSTGLWKDVSDNEYTMKLKLDSGMDVKVVGIIKPGENATSNILSGNLAYTVALTEHVISSTLDTDIAKEQLKSENLNYDIFTGLNFIAESNLTPEQKVQTFKTYIDKAGDSSKAKLYFDIMCTPSDEDVEKSVKKYKEQFFASGSEADYRTMLANLLTSQNLIDGMDKDSLMAFLGSYTDKELEEMVDEYLVEMVKTSMYDEKKAEIIEKLSAPSAETLAQFKEKISAGILATELAPGMPITKEMYVAYEYSKMTGVSVETYISLILEGKLDAVKAYDQLVSDMATKEYAERVTVSEAQINESVSKTLDEYVVSLSNEDIVKVFDSYLLGELSENTYEDNLEIIGICNLDKPSAVNIYATSFENKDMIASEIEKYNSGVGDEDKITYTDYVAILMSSVTTIINVISYVLIGFVSVSLVVSSIMIGIITNISVLERTKEIGILRAIGASKKDISRVFNAETFIIGLAAGILGIVTTLILCIPTNAIIQALTGFENINATLPAAGAVVLVMISMFLTIIAGLIPAKKASRKDPVIALRTE